MRWTLKPKPLAPDTLRLTEALQVPPLIAELLLQRGVTDFAAAKRFFRPQLEELHDPFLMADMEQAVSRLEAAMDKGEYILVYGDYDVDGTTAVALLFSYLKKRYDKVATYIPDRYDEGYGVSYKGIDFADDNGISLIIALDCGIKAIDKVAYAQEKGIDFIICDHHRPGDRLPDAFAVLDPKRTDCAYPYKELCGCGVGFKLIQALEIRQGRSIDSLRSYLDLVATAIAADIVPMTGENRILAYYGLQQLNQDPRIGLKGIIEHIKKSQLTITDVVFIIAPRINAAGRMRHGQFAVDLLIADDWDRAQAIAAEIENFNADRRGTDQMITEEALAQITSNNEEERHTTVVLGSHWHKGVIGIVASRLIETYYRPTLVFTKSGGKLAASARSVKGFDVYKALEACSEHIEQFGGHKYAAGLTLSEDQYEPFKAKFEQVVADTLPTELRTPEIVIDQQIALGDINAKLLRILKQFAPFGPGNMMPTFMAHKVADSGYAKTVGETGKHLKLALTQNGSVPIGGIGFGLGEKLPVVKRHRYFDVVFAVEENEWNGRKNIQLKLKDIQ
ncbi:single-stranded-DNA-specific exonuclease RecJ [Flagellimonas sp. DF-77]|uniref:single-stranded-DNA-specific exonuclease RecJ n=1 Tax=Flagellimonas algarum TaxID=3230298 RepID=UPI003397A4EE